MNFGDTPYPALAAMHRAAVLVNENKAEEALQVLETVLADVRNPALAQIIHLRAASAELILGRHEAALAALAIQHYLYPATRQLLQYTTTSPIMRERLGVAAPD